MAGLWRIPMGRAITIMPPDRDLLTLVQWLSPAFPVGGFAYSHGLDWVIGGTECRDARALEVWLRGVLHHGGGWNDAVALSLMLRGADPDRIAALVLALAGSAERRRETLAQGRAFSAAVGALTDRPARDWPLPVAVGDAARRLEVPVETMISLYLQSFVTNLSMVATRAVPLGQNEGQRLIQALSADLPDLAARAAKADEDDFGTGAPLADLAAMLHETQEPRLFLT
ncbi:MAG: urease accessory protein UreF [Qingshengfaniella sp.]